MTADAGECNGRIEGSKVEFELKTGVDLREDDDNGEEIGGSFVIVNGDSDGHSGRDLDHEEKLENEETGGKEKSIVVGRVKNEIIEERSNGGNNQHDDVRGSRSDIKVEEEAFCGDSVGVEQIEKEDNLCGEDLGSLNVVEEKQEGEPLVVDAEEKQHEAEVESDSKVEVGSEVEKQDIKEPRIVIMEANHLEKSDSASKVDDDDLGSLNAREEKQDGEALVVKVKEEEALTHLDEQEESEVVIGESDSNLELGSEVEKEDVTELQAPVMVGSRVDELESASQVEIEKEAVNNKEDVGSVKLEESQEPVNVVEETGSVEELESAIEAELEQEPCILVERGNVATLELPVEVELRQEANAGVEKIERLAEVESAVEEERKQESNTAAEERENLEEVKSAVEVELKEEHDAKVVEMDKVEDVEGKEPELVFEENCSQGEIRSVVEVETEPETVSEVADEIEVEEMKRPDVVATEQTTSEHFPLENEESRISNADADAPTDESSAQLENGSADATAEISVEANAICDIIGNCDSKTEVIDHSLPDKLNGGASNIALQSSEKPQNCLDSRQELVEEVGPADNKCGEMEVNDGDMIPSEPKADISCKDIEPSSHGSVNGVDEPQTRELCPKKDIEIEAKDSIGNAESNKDVVDEMKLDTESGTEGSECMVSSVDGEQSTNKDDDEEPIHEQAQAAEIMQAPQETHVVKRQYVYMIKVPRFLDDLLQKKIQHARLIIDEKTHIRDSIGEETRAQAVVVNKFSLDYKAALAKERAARAIFNAKRQEVENVQASINRINNANSIADIDEKIRNMMHRQQHETISLKQEKQYIHDINQMRRLREQLSSKKPVQELIDETPSKREEIEAMFKNLKKELDSLRTALSSAESSTKSAWNKYIDEEQQLRSLKEKHNDADRVRQEAYLHWRKLKIQLAEKAKHFKMFKADQSAATNYIFSGDSQGLRSHCSRQVEKIMDIWNNDPEFREQYVKSNTYSTLRRLGTSDGRSLGPGEEAPIIRSNLDRNTKIDPLPSLNIESPASVLAPDVKKEKLTEPAAPKQVARTNQSAKLKSSTKPIVVEGSIPAVSNSEDLEEREKDNEMKKEEEEMAKKVEELTRKAEELVRKEEELRKEKAEAELKEQLRVEELKEQLRVEQKAKAREAEERKRRKAEKAQARAEYRAQKEAELKQKRKAKKENKKSGMVDTDATNGGAEGGSTPVHDTNPQEVSQELEPSSIATSRRRSSRPISSMKQYNKVQPPIPLPLRKRSRRKLMAWIWATLIILLVLALFFAGNYISFSSSSLQYFGF